MSDQKKKLTDAEINTYQVPKAPEDEGCARRDWAAWTDRTVSPIRIGLCLIKRRRKENSFPICCNHESGRL